MVELRNRRVGLCLSSGFFGYYAHCGFMRAIKSLEVEPRAVTGCSAGAILGGLWASGLSVEQVEDVLFAVGPRDLLDPPRIGDLRRGIAGAVSGQRLERMLEGALAVSTFERCPIPFAATTFDLADGTLRVIDSGSLARGIRASASLPGMFVPATVDGHPCWDGAVMQKTPLGPLMARDDLDVVVVCYLARPVAELPPRSFRAGIRLALDTLIYQADRQLLTAARAQGLEVVVVAPDVPRCGPHRMGMGREIARVAESETLRILQDETFGCPELA